MSKIKIQTLRLVAITVTSFTAGMAMAVFAYINFVAYPVLEQESTRLATGDALATAAIAEITELFEPTNIVIASALTGRVFATVEVSPTQVLSEAVAVWCSTNGPIRYEDVRWYEKGK